MYDETERIEKYLYNHDIYPTFVDWLDDDTVRVFIEDGDWKHEHLYCTVLMNELGFTDGGEDVVESDGSDCYSATHIYLRKGEKK